LKDFGLRFSANKNSFIYNGKTIFHNDITSTLERMQTQTLMMCSNRHINDIEFSFYYWYVVSINIKGVNRKNVALILVQGMVKFCASA
jgi:hypothetical protein